MSVSTPLSAQLPLPSTWEFPDVVGGVEFLEKPFKACNGPITLNNLSFPVLETKEGSVPSELEATNDELTSEAEVDKASSSDPL